MYYSAHYGHRFVVRTNVAQSSFTTNVHTWNAQYSVLNMLYQHTAICWTDNWVTVLMKHRIQSTYYPHMITAHGTSTLLHFQVLVSTESKDKNR